jgi:hypothetical protein
MTTARGPLRTAKDLVFMMDLWRARVFEQNACHASEMLGCAGILDDPTGDTYRPGIV